MEKKAKRCLYGYLVLIKVFNGSIFNSAVTSKFIELILLSRLCLINSNSIVAN